MKRLVAWESFPWSPRRPLVEAFIHLIQSLNKNLLAEDVTANELEGKWL